MDNQEVPRKVIDHLRLYGFFLEKLKQIYPSMAVFNREEKINAWKGLLEKHGCRLVFAAEMADLVNEGPGDYVCMASYRVNVANDAWVLVPMDFAEKAMVLGSLP